MLNRDQLFDKLLPQSLKFSEGQVVFSRGEIKSYVKILKESFKDTNQSAGVGLKILKVKLSASVVSLHNILYEWFQLEYDSRVEKSKTVTLGKVKGVYGFTPKILKKYLGEPDAYVRNPHYRHSSPMQLFSIARIEMVKIQYPELEEILEKRLLSRITNHEARSKAVQDRMEKKKEALLQSIRDLKIKLPNFSYEKLANRACRHYEELHWGRGKYNSYACPDTSDSDFIYRIAQNYIRHECSDYEYILEDLWGCVGKDEAYWELKEKINDEFDLKYSGFMSWLNNRPRTKTRAIAA